MRSSERVDPSRRYDQLINTVASGAYDITLALGAEKLRDTGYGGLPAAGSLDGTLVWQWMPQVTAPGEFAQLASGYAAKHGITMSDLKRAMAHFSAKSHANAALNPKAHLRKAVSVEEVMAAPIVACPLGLFDCCGVSDGAACAIVTTPEIAKALDKRDRVSVKALQLAVSNGSEVGYSAGCRSLRHGFSLQHDGLQGGGNHLTARGDQHD